MNFDRGATRDSSAFRNRCETEFRGHPHECGERVGLHLLHHFAAMRLDRDFADAELRSDLLVKPTTDYRRQDFTFARSERGITVSKNLRLGLLTQRSAAALEGVPNDFEQCFVA